MRNVLGTVAVAACLGCVAVREASARPRAGCPGEACGVSVAASHLPASLGHDSCSGGFCGAAPAGPNLPATSFPAPGGLVICEASPVTGQSSTFTLSLPGAAPLMTQGGSCLPVFAYPPDSGMPLAVIQPAPLVGGTCAPIGVPVMPAAAD